MLSESRIISFTKRLPLLCLFADCRTSSGVFDDLVYANDTGWTQITAADAEFNVHNAYDGSDPNYVLVTNSVAYRYYAFKFATNQGDSQYMGVRQIELQTEDPTDLFDTYDKRIKLTIDMTRLTLTLLGFL